MPLRTSEYDPDAFSRALLGQRNFSSLGAARLAELLDANLCWLITGDPDPHRLSVMSRHGSGSASGDSVVPGRTSDEQAINDISLAYRQAYPSPGALPSLPASADAARAALGRHFVRSETAPRDRRDPDTGAAWVLDVDPDTPDQSEIGARELAAVLEL